MKTPEEIKRGLVHCSNDSTFCNAKCPYFNASSNGVDCATEMHGNGLAYIQQLEQDNAQKDERIRQLEQRVPRWISVHDALPGMDEKVLFIPACNPRSVYIGKLKYVGEVNAVYFVVNNWRRTVTYSATHWMPLPEPPEEDSE